MAFLMIWLEFFDGFVSYMYIFVTPLLGESSILPAEVYPQSYTTVILTARFL